MKDLLRTEIIAGIDEVGRGPLAGPVVTAAVILLHPINGLADSKILTKRRREELYPVIMSQALVGIGAASVREIDQLNILQATLLAMRRSVARLPRTPTLALVDGNQNPGLGIRTELVIKGDATVPEISAASIVAKVVRDRLILREFETPLPPPPPPPLSPPPRVRPPPRPLPPRPPRPPPLPALTWGSPSSPLPATKGPRRATPSRQARGARATTAKRPPPPRRPRAAGTARRACSRAATAGGCRSEVGTIRAREAGGLWEGGRGVPPRC